MKFGTYRVFAPKNAAEVIGELAQMKPWSAQAFSSRSPGSLGLNPAYSDFLVDLQIVIITLLGQFRHAPEV